MNTPEPVATFEGEPQYAQATTADGSVIVASSPPETWADADIEAEPG